MIIYVPITEPNKIILEKEQFEQLAEKLKQEGYTQGFKDGMSLRKNNSR